MDWRFCEFVIRFWSLLETQREITRRRGLFQDTFSWLWEMTRSWASFWVMWRLLMVVWCPTFTTFFCPRRPVARRNPLKMIKQDKFLFWNDDRWWCYSEIRNSVSMVFGFKGILVGRVLQICAYWENHQSVFVFVAYYYYYYYSEMETLVCYFDLSIFFSGSSLNLVYWLIHFCIIGKIQFNRS